MDPCSFYAKVRRECAYQRRIAGLEIAHAGRWAYNGTIIIRNGLIWMASRDPRRKYILAAAQLIKENGEENVSARKIATILGTAPSAIYRHFATLDELMAYVFILNS